MFKKITSKDEVNIFNQILAKNWDEKEFFRQEVDGNTDLFLFGPNQNEFAATLECKPLNKDIYQSSFPLDNYDFVQSGEKIVEIDYVSILAEYRSTGLLGELITVLIDYCLEHDFEYIFAMIDTTFCTSLIRSYRIPVERLGEKMILPHEKSPIYPTVTSVSAIKAKLDSYEWYQRHSKRLMNA